MEITIGLLKNAMAASKGTRFLIDGFPRQMDQALKFEETVRVRPSMYACMCVYVCKCPVPALTEREGEMHGYRCASVRTCCTLSAQRMKWSAGCCAAARPVAVWTITSSPSASGA
jgi:hypothetical protein